MHALPEPKHPMFFGALVLALVLFLLAAAAPDLGSLEISFGGSAGSEGTAPPSVVPEPTWAEDPLRSPLQNFTR